MMSEAYTKKEVKSLECYSSVYPMSSVPDILRNFKEPRKIFRGIFFLFFLSGFLFQVITFLEIVYKYPTVFSIDISQTGEYLSPAYTICSSIKVSRKKYCEKYEDRCLPTDEHFCNINRKYCEKNNMTVKEEYTLNVSQADAAELKFNYSDFISASYPESYESILTVPRQRFEHNDFHHSYCFAIKSRVESYSPPIMVYKEKSDDPSGILDKYIFDPQMNDVFELDVPPGIFFAVHSPYDAVNPFERGYFLSPGKHYIIDVFIREDKKLSYPYDTDCTDYEEQWLENGFTGARSKQMCRQKCHVDYFAECYNCSRIDFEYPSQEKICSSEEIRIKKDYLTDECNKRKPELCEEECKEECFKTSFLTTIKERPLRLSAVLLNNTDYISVDVEVYDENIMHHKYVPKYENIEVFSYVGGFIGMWLGISCVQVVQILESFFIIVIKFLKSNKTDSTKESA